MVLESTFICVDNSEYMRNGDFLPTRLQAQQDAVGIVTQTKLRSNPESNVGLLALGGLDVLTTLTTDSSKILAKLTGVKPKGKVMLIPGIKIAHLALKHRIGKNHKTRIVVFIGSPIETDEKEVVKLAKKLKKEKVSVDVVSFGEVEANEDILTKFIEAVNGKEGTGSHLVAIPPGPHLSDALISSPILQGEDGGSSGPSGFEFGVDPNEDPELALALRVSMEEQRARQEAPSAAAAPAEGGGASDADRSESSTATQRASGAEETQDEEQLLQRALEMSMGGEGSAPPSANEPNLASMTEEEQIAYAMRMSMQDSEPASSATDDKMEVDEESKPGKMDVDDAAKEEEEDYSEVMNDPAFLQSVLENLPGVDPQSEAVRQAVGAMTGTSTESSTKSKKDSSKDKDKDKK